MASTIKAASLMAAGQAISAGLISAKVVALTEGVVKTMFVSKIKSSDGGGAGRWCWSSVGLVSVTACSATRRQWPNRERTQAVEKTPAAKDEKNVPMDNANKSGEKKKPDDQGDGLPSVSMSAVDAGNPLGRWGLARL